MAKISTYPIVSTPTVNDLLIGTDAENLNETKNFALGDIADLIIGGTYVPYIGANSNVDLGSFSIEASSFILPGGLSSQFLKADGSLDSTVYQVAGNYITGLSGEATASGPGVATVTLDNGAVIGKVLTGLSITGGSVSSTDTILQAFGKLQNQVNSLYGGAIYQGTWNASTNTPALSSGVGTQGWYYVVNVAGSTDIDGITDWNVGDWIIFDGTAWQQVDNTDTVVSVNGKVGVVVLTTTDIAEGTRLYYTDGRARGAISLTTTGSSGSSSYDNITGILNVPNYTISGLGGVPSSRQLTINGTSYDLSSDRSWAVGTVTSISTSGPITGGTITGSGTIGITQSGISSNGYLSSVDWNTFNNKQNALTNPVTGTGTTYYLPMWTGVSSLGDSSISQGANTINFNYDNATGATVNYINRYNTDYTYTIQMNNVGTRQTYHSYTDGNILQQINGVVISKNLQSGQLVLPNYTATTSFTGTNVGYLGFDASGNILTVPVPSLTGYVPYTGATGNVNLGEYELMAGQIEFDQSPTGTAGVAILRWNNTDGTLELGLKGGNVTLQIGQEQVQRVVNKSGIALTEAAYQVVKVTDAQGQRLAVDLAQGDSDANSTDTIGIVTETIAVNQEGFITTSGLVNEINTTGSLQGETWVDGDVLYLSPTIAGAITNIKPTAPNHTVILGYVVYAHINHGKIFVKCDNGYEIGELHNCYLPSPSNNDGIFWNTANQRYQNNSIVGALGYTPYNATNPSGFVSYNLYTSDGILAGDRYINGNSKNLWINDINTLRVSVGVVATNVVALFQATEPNITIEALGSTNSAALFLKPSAGFNGAIHNRTGGGLDFYTGAIPSLSATITANNNLLVGTAADAGYRVQITSASADSHLNVWGASAPSIRIDNAATGATQRFVFGLATATNNFIIGAVAGDICMTTQSNNPLLFGANALEVMRITTARNLLIGTQSDTGEKIQVNGTARINGNVNIGTNAISYGALQINGSNSANILLYDGYATTTIQSYNASAFTILNQIGATSTNLMNYDYTTKDLTFQTNGNNTRLTLKSNGSVRYTPMATPGTASAGDVYYDSTSNKLRCYNGTIWNDLF